MPSGGKFFIRDNLLLPVLHYVDVFFLIFNFIVSFIILRPCVLTMQC
jgi:hypothetical protein